MITDKLLAEQYLYMKKIVRSYIQYTEEDIEDVLQIAQLQAWRKQAQFRGQCDIKTWLYLVVRSSALNYIKKNKKYSKIYIKKVSFFENDDMQQNFQEDIHKPLTYHNDTPESINEAEETLLRAIGRLTPKLYRALEAYHFQGISFEEISLQENIPIGTSKQRSSRCKTEIEAYFRR